MKIVGPEGTAALAENIVAAYSWDIATRIADQNLAPDGAKIDARDITPAFSMTRMA